MMKYYLLLICDLFWLVACASPSQFQAVTLPSPSATPVPTMMPAILQAFPLEVGRTWVYSVTKQIAPISSNGDITFVNHTGIITETVVASQQEGNSLIFTSTLAAVPEVLNDQFDQIRRYEVNNDAIFFNHHITLLRWPLSVQQEWDAFGDVAPDFKAVYFWRVLDKKTVTVPAGRFEDCFQLMLQTGPDHSINWLCPGTGIVRVEYHHHGTVDNQYWELQSTSVP
jgi:hypothetical protein